MDRQRDKEKAEVFSNFMPMLPTEIHDDEEVQKKRYVTTIKLKSLENIPVID